MDRAVDTRTSVTLLGRLRDYPRDAEAWEMFVDRYGRLILSWCRRWGVQEADAQDVMQTVLVKLAERLQKLEYDSARSFRGWLRTITRHAWCDLIESSVRAGQGSGDTRVVGLLQTVEARDDLVAHLNEEFERALLEEALAKVRTRVAARTWEVFRLLAIEGRPGDEVAAHTGMSITAVYMAKSRVQTMLRTEIAKLQGTEPD